MFILLGVLIEFFACEASGGRLISGLQIVPPPGKFGVNHEAFDKNSINASNSPWSIDSRLPNDDGFIWEKSGLYEGDIMFYKGDSKNGIIEKTRHWKNATIPFYIEESHFGDDEIRTILMAIKEFHKKTCLRLRPFKKSDENWVFITGNSSGCW
jgi:hypothetical protein